MKKIFFFLFAISFLHAQPSRFELKTYYSAIFNTLKYYYIYLPPNYDSTIERYPVVYLFRGAASEWTNDGQDGSRKGTIKTVADSLIAKNAMGNVILVMPGFSAPPIGNDYLSFYQELIPQVDKTFRTYKSRWMRGIDGFSLGGLTTLTMMSTHPNYFSSIGSYDGTFSLFNKSLLTNASPALIAELKRLKILFHSASLLGQSNYNNNLEIVNLLAQKGITNTFLQLILAPNALHNWYFADLHMAINFPYHYQKFFSAQQNISTTIFSPLGNQKLSGSFPIIWNKPTVNDSVSVFLFFSDNDGKNWNFLAQKPSNDTSIQFNSLLYPDGSLYKFRVMTLGDTISNITETPRVTIDNPGNGAPYIFLLNPAGGTLSGNISIQWESNDPDGDEIRINIFVSFNDGKSWIPIQTTMPNSGMYVLNTAMLPNSSTVLFKLEANDGTVTASFISPLRCKINNPRAVYPASALKHISGSSTATITLTKNNSVPATTDTYRISFSKIEQNKFYSVSNVTTNTLLLSQQQWDNAFTEGPAFDGFHLLIDEPKKIAVMNDSLRWKLSTSNLEGYVGLMDIILENQTITAQAFPYDYEIRISESISDTSAPYFEVPEIQTYFSVWNATKNSKIKFIYIDFNNDSKISDLDELYLFEIFSDKNPQLTWHIVFTGVTGAVSPKPNDIFRIVTTKPLEQDIYEFTAYPLSANGGNVLPDRYELFQNFPNPFNPETIIRYQVPNNNIVTIKIFDILGREIAVVFNDYQSAGEHSIIFNALNYSIASGVYFYRMQSGKFSSTKKLIIAK